jgi:hypothetical protein
MTNRVLSIAVFAVITLLISCNGNSKKEKVSKEEGQATQIDIASELQKWKKELIDSKKLGTPCNFEAIGSVEAQEWVKKNGQDLMDGFPQKDTAIKTAFADFDGDSKEDLILYFIAENCTGHNGGTPSFAKIVYANGTSDKDLMANIKKGIISGYNEKKETDATLKEISDSYLNENVSIAYEKGVVGVFYLYTKEDAHCCPTYSGTYKYNVATQKTDIVVEESGN